MIVRKVEASDIEQLIILMTEFRMFYNQEPYQDELRTFIRNRINNKDSEIFVAVIDDKLVGYTQLFPSFSTINLCKIWILNDLYISATFRRKGIAAYLIETVFKFSEQNQIKHVWLLTGDDNTKAQELYKKKGFTSTNFKHYVCHI